MPARVVSYLRRHRRSEARRRPPDGDFFYDSNFDFSSSNSDASNRNSGQRRHHFRLRSARTIFLCGCRIDVSFTPRGRRLQRDTSLEAHVNSSSVLANLEFDPGGSPSIAEVAVMPPHPSRLSRSTRRRLALCGFDVATTSTSTFHSKRRRTSSGVARVDGTNGSEYESISSSRVGDNNFVTTMQSVAPLLEPQPQFETPPPESIDDIDDISEHAWPTHVPNAVSDIVFGGFKETRPRSRISVGCNGWITSDSPPKAVTRLSEVVEDIVSPEQSQFSVSIGDDTSDTISKYAFDSFRGAPPPMNINFDLISVEYLSSRGGEECTNSVADCENGRSSIDSASSSARERKRVSAPGSFSLDDVARRSLGGIPYRITEDAPVIQLHNTPENQSVGSVTSLDSSSRHSRLSLLPFHRGKTKRRPSTATALQESSKQQLVDCTL